MNPKIFLLSTVVGILATYLIFLISDVFFGLLPDDYGAIAIALFIGSGTHILVRHFLSRTAEKQKY